MVYAVITLIIGIVWPLIGILVAGRDDGNRTSGPLGLWLLFFVLPGAAVAIMSLLFICYLLIVHHT